MEEQKEKLAEDGASLIVWTIITILLYVFTSDLWWLVVKFIMTVMLIFGTVSPFAKPPRKKQS